MAPRTALDDRHDRVDDRSGDGSEPAQEPDAPDDRLDDARRLPGAGEADEQVLDVAPCRRRGARRASAIRRDDHRRVRPDADVRRKPVAHHSGRRRSVERRGHTHRAAACRSGGEHVSLRHLHAEDVPPHRAQDQLPVAGRATSPRRARCPRPPVSPPRRRHRCCSSPRCRCSRRVPRGRSSRSAIPSPTARARTRTPTAAGPICSRSGYRLWPTARRSRSLNAGIGSNRFEASDGAGLSGLHRLPDLLALPGVKWVVIFEGINDISYEHATAASDHRRVPERDRAGTRGGRRRDRHPALADQALDEGRRQQRGDPRGSQRLDPHLAGPSTM